MAERANVASFEYLDTVADSVLFTSRFSVMDRRSYRGHDELRRYFAELDEGVPALLRRAWEIQAEHRAEFIAQVGSDLVVLPPHEAQETMREHYRRWQRKAAAKLEGKAAKRAMTAGPAPEGLGQLPDELLDADSVALIYDEIEGLNFFRDFGRLYALFADPTLARDRTCGCQKRRTRHATC